MSTLALTQLQSSEHPCGHMHEGISVRLGGAVRCTGGWTPPSHHAVLDDHLTKLYAAAKCQLQSYEAALAERRRKAALLSDGKKMENGRPCANFMFAMLLKNVAHLDTARLGGA